MNAEQTATRLQEATAKCLTSLDAWNKNLKDVEARESLLDSLHELRKVTSRLEIDIAMNDRKATNSKPLPIPEHKSKTERKTNKPLSEILPVAEIKEEKKKRKIDIEESKEKPVNTSHDESGENDDNEAKKDKPKRRPRKKREDKSQDSQD